MGENTVWVWRTPRDFPVHPDPFVVPHACQIRRYLQQVGILFAPTSLLPKSEDFGESKQVRKTARIIDSL
jgi:hypothetical protein